MPKFIFLFILAIVAIAPCTAQTSNAIVKFHKDTVLADGKALALVKSSNTLPVSYTISRPEGTALVSIKPVYVQVATGKRMGYYLITFIETGQTFERDITPNFSRSFVKELIYTETLTKGGIDFDNARRFAHKNQQVISAEIQSKIKQ
ncbi:MAG: hypothetical protein U5L45_24075 [Saprospiraceae bacterium]|nr:hypothetical protein [Saprospiraceae bacterium]